MTLPDAMDFEDAVDEAGYEGDFDRGYDDEDQAYDAYVDGIVEDYFDRLDERQGLYKKLLLCDYHGNHNKDRDDLEKQLLKNLTGTDMGWKENAGDPRK